MPPPTTPYASHVEPSRWDVLFEEVTELTGQRNAIDGRLVEIIAEVDGAGTSDGNALRGGTGCRTIQALVAWKTGVSTHGLREGRVSLDQTTTTVDELAHNGFHVIGLVPRGRRSTLVAHVLDHRK